MLTKIIIYCKCKVNKTNEKEKILVLTSNKGVEQMKWLVAGMRSEFVEDFIRWMKENNIRVSEQPFSTGDIWRVLYMPIGREQKFKCENYIEYRCNNNLM